jgi:nitric oxide synthase-interacting protein
LKKAEVDKAERPACLECGKAIKSATKDLIALQREGTGFASAGGSETKKKGISFQG